MQDQVFTCNSILGLCDQGGSRKSILSMQGLVFFYL